ncbi:MAG: hypothetical protein IMZ61_06630 [Planctomycetes bacterium]|nr:hypothetical protein [Planctomycetota bacterium]
MAQKSVLFKILGVFVLGVIVGVGFSQLYLLINQQNQQPALTLGQTYQNAVEDAMVAKPSEVYSGLTPILESNHNLNWTGASGNESVLVVTFTKYASSYPVGQTVNATWGDTWVTVAPELKTFFKTNVGANTNFTLRTLQLLGLPPNNTNSYFVEMRVNPQALFRPTTDNEVNDTTAQLTFPDSATLDYKAWFNSNIIYSYYPERFPWTRLGYTYDWGNSDSHVGLSEFVIKQNSLVVVESVTSIQDYLNG